MHWEAAPHGAAAGSPTSPQCSRARPRAALSVYVHVPFCQSLCTFCGCNMRVARNHALAGPYVDTVLAEFALYRQRLGARAAAARRAAPGRRHAHLPARRANSTGCSTGSWSTAPSRRTRIWPIEVDPRITTREQLRCCGGMASTASASACRTSTRACWTSSTACRPKRRCGGGRRSARARDSRACHST